jgi:hypothetical protein
MALVQRQLGVFKKRLQEVLHLALLRNDSTDDLAEVVRTVGNKVRQIRPFGVAPTLLRPVQSWREE